MSGKKKLAILALITVAGLLPLLYAADQTQGEIRALLWHTKHGSTAETNGITFSVPLWYYANIGARNEIVFNTSPGWFRSKLTPAGKLKFGIITVDIDSASLAGHTREYLDSLTSVFLRTGFQKTGEPAPMFLQQQGRCVELTGPPLAADGDKHINIICVFGSDTAASFDGNAAAAPDFYNLLQTAKPVRR